MIVCANIYQFFLLIIFSVLLITDFVVDHISTDTNDFTITPTGGSVSFTAGSTISSESVTISVNTDNVVEDEESFILRLMDPSGSLCPNGNLEDPYILKVRIIDNDGMLTYAVAKWK